MPGVAGYLNGRFPICPTCGGDGNDYHCTCGDKNMAEKTAVGADKVQPPPPPKVRSHDIDIDGEGSLNMSQTATLKLIVSDAVAAYMEKIRGLSVPCDEGEFRNLSIHLKNLIIIESRLS